MNAGELEHKSSISMSVGSSNHCPLFLLEIILIERETYARGQRAGTLSIMVINFVLGHGSQQSTILVYGLHVRETR